MAKKSTKGTMKRMAQVTPFKRQKLEALMRRHKLDAYDLAKELGMRGVMCGPYVIRELLNGRRVQPRGDVLAGLCAVFKVGVSTFYDLA